MDHGAPETGGDEPSLASKVHSIVASPEGVESARDRPETIRASMDRAPDLFPPRDRHDLTPMPAVRPSLYDGNHQRVSVAANLLQPSLATLQLAIAHPFTTATFGTIGASRLPSILTWAAEQTPDRLERLLDEARPYLPMATASSVVDLVGSLAELERRRSFANVFATVLTQRPLEPVGLLHLERLEMTPLEIERGELVYSLPLAPHEKVTLAHKEWTTREEEFSRYVQDFFENFSETGVAEADDIAMSSLTQTRHANALSMSQSPVGTSGVTITNAADGSAAASSVEDLVSIEESKYHARTVTSKATARNIKDHKVSFTVTTVTGVEDFTARVLENVRDNEAMRIDYFRRMRRWRTDLYRYGVRMTYDVVLPDPGHRIRHRHALIQAIDEQLASGSQFTLKPSDITVWNWKQLADQYGTSLEPPREMQRRFEVVRQVDYGPAEEVNIGGSVHTRQKVEEMQVDVPTDYQLSSIAVIVQVSTWHVAFQQRWITIIGDGVVRSFIPDMTGHISGTIILARIMHDGARPVKFVFVRQGLKG
jgi:hypothetical protein